MTYVSQQRPQLAAAELAGRARAASRALAKLPNQARSAALIAVAKGIEDNAREILEANENDYPKHAERIPINHRCQQLIRAPQGQFIL